MSSPLSLLEYACLEPWEIWPMNKTRLLMRWWAVAPGWYLSPIRPLYLKCPSLKFGSSSSSPCSSAWELIRSSPQWKWSLQQSKTLTVRGFSAIWNVMKYSSWSFVSSRSFSAYQMLCKEVSTSSLSSITTLPPFHWCTWPSSKLWPSSGSTEPIA